MEAIEAYVIGQEMNIKVKFISDADLKKQKLEHLKWKTQKNNWLNSVQSRFRPKNHTFIFFLFLFLKFVSFFPWFNLSFISKTYNDSVNNNFKR